MNSRFLLEQILRSQAYRELGAARLFQAGMKLAPTAAARDEITAQAQEERGHLDEVLSLWAQLTSEPRAQLEARVEARLAERPLPRPGTWIDLAMARFLYDRAGSWQLREYTDCSWRPYRELVQRIVTDERGHQDTGARDVLALCRPETSPMEPIQPIFERWLRPALLSFGRPGSPASAQAIALGLKKRDPADVRQDFLDEVRPGIAKAGLRLPSLDELGLD